jgi:hypothetical protein
MFSPGTDSENAQPELRDSVRKSLYAGQAGKRVWAVFGQFKSEAGFHFGKRQLRRWKSIGRD